MTGGVHIVCGAKLISSCIEEVLGVNKHVFGTTTRDSCLKLLLITMQCHSLTDLFLSYKLLNCRGSHARSKQFDLIFEVERGKRQFRISRSHFSMECRPLPTYS